MLRFTEEVMTIYNCLVLLRLREGLEISYFSKIENNMEGRDVNKLNKVIWAVFLL